MYLCRQQLGTWIDIPLSVVDASRTPMMPDAVPTIKIRRASDGAVVYNSLMPVVEKAGAGIGLFCSRLLLGSGFSVGFCDVTMFYVAGGAGFTVLKNFEIMDAGDQRGQVLAMIYSHTPQSENIIYQVDSGLILRGKNPKTS